MKVIDLLNKIANGEEVPNKIRFDNKEWNRVCGEKNVYYIDDTDDDLFVYFFRRNIIFTLNDEVEIIEEDKKIEKLREPFLQEETLNYVKLLKSKINELIDKINEEK